METRFGIACRENGALGAGVAVAKPLQRRWHVPHISLVYGGEVTVQGACATVQGIGFWLRTKGSWVRV